MSKNDERVLQLKKLIETKKSELSTQRFVPMTNCVLDMEDKKYNLNVLQEKRIGIFNGKTKCICNVCR